MNESEGSNPAQPNANLRFPLPSGTRVDHYVIREVLGAGGFGITYLAEHEALAKQYAIKEYFPHAFSVRQGQSVRPTSASDGTYKWGLERFVTEARALAKFKHPAIVDVTSIFEANGTAYIVLGYESGLDMAGWAKKLGRPPSQDELDRILAPLLSALEEIHRHNILHRDISPDNILIREDGRPVLIDFGSAREQIRGRARALSAIVKHGYSPPEQYTSKPELQGPWTDIYALSATLYRSITGKLPPDATERFVRDDLVPITQLARAAYRPSFLEAINRGLKMKGEERPQTVIEWREMLFRAEPLRQPAAEATRASAGTSGAPSQPAASSKARDPRALSPSARILPPGGLAAPGGSQRVSSRLAADGALIAQTSSIPKSERPSLDWLDGEEDLLLGPDDPGEKNPTIPYIHYGITGLIGGAIVGALFSIVLAGIISTNCFADSCILRYLGVCSTIGAVAGLVFGLQLAKNSVGAATELPRPPTHV